MEELFGTIICATTTEEIDTIPLLRGIQYPRLGSGVFHVFARDADVIIALGKETKKTNGLLRRCARHLPYAILFVIWYTGDDHVCDRSTSPVWLTGECTDIAVCNSLWPRK